MVGHRESGRSPRASSALASAPPHQARRRLPHVDVGTGGRARDGAPRGDEGDARGPEVLHERAAVRAAWIEGHVERVAMIESHSIVERSLAVSADWQRSAEARLEEALKLG